LKAAELGAAELILVARQIGLMGALINGEVNQQKWWTNE
jgi:hypothetical protein